MTTVIEGRAVPRSALSGWTGIGEGLVSFVPDRRPRRELPPGFRPLGGPRLVLAARYADSPVGPYHEIAVSEPVRVGRVVGMFVTTIVCDCAEAVTIGRDEWGFPKEFERLRWSEEGDIRTMTWESRGIVVRGTATRIALPPAFFFRSIQGTEEGPMLVGGRIRGRLRVARVEVAVPPGDPLLDVAGSHRGLVMTAASLRMTTSRRLSGFERGETRLT